METPNPVDLARAFDNELRADLKPYEYIEAVRRNAEDPAYGPDSGVCASHDFCDANMSMLAAFAKVTGKSEDEIVRLTCGDDGDAAADGAWCTAWNAAFDAWRSIPKTLPELPEGAELTTAGALRSRCDAEGVTTEDADPEWHGIRKEHPDTHPYIVWEDGSMQPVVGFLVGGVA